MCENRGMTRITATICAILALSGCTILPEGRSKSSPQVSQSKGRTPISTPMTMSPGEGQCLAELGATRAAFSPVADKYYGAGCSTLNSVKLSALGGDQSSLAVSNLGPVACPLANTFAGWARYGVDRAARQILGSPLVKIETMGSYACRNVAGTGRRSAHATAEAIDVSAFVLADGRRISVLGGWKGNAREREFLKIIHESACKRFGTVLGPNYNAAHHDHFHVETRGGGFCR